MAVAGRTGERGKGRKRERNYNTRKMSEMKGSGERGTSTTDGKSNMRRRVYSSLALLCIVISGCLWPRPLYLLVYLPVSMRPSVWLFISGYLIYRLRTRALVRACRPARAFANLFPFFLLIRGILRRATRFAICAECKYAGH